MASVTAAAGGRVRQLAHHVVAGNVVAQRTIEANSEPTADGEGPLAGVIVLDLTQMVSGPMGTQIIGDQGADVIKIENTTSGAAERGGARTTMTNPMMSVINRNKRGLSLDLKREEGVDVFLRLVKTAGVFSLIFRWRSLCVCRSHYNFRCFFDVLQTWSCKISGPA